MPGLEVDLFVEEPIAFDEAYSRSVRAPLDTTWATAAAINDLVRMKEKSGRPVEVADAEALRAIARHMRGSR